MTHVIVYCQHDFFVVGSRLSIGPIGVTVLASVEGFAILIRLTAPRHAFLLVFKTKHT